MKRRGLFFVVLVLMLTPIFFTNASQKAFNLSDSQYKDAFGNLPPGWTSKTIYQTNPLGPISICETNANEVLILDKSMNEILEIELNTSVYTYLATGDIALDAIAFQPNANRGIGIGLGAFFIFNESTIEVIKEYPLDVEFSTLVVDPSDDSIYTGHWANGSSIYHFDANGEYISTIREGVEGCAQVAVDSSRNLLYYSETFPGRITRLNMTTNTTTVLTSGIALPGTGEGISIATNPVGDLFYLVAEGAEKGFHRYNGTDFEYIMEAKSGIGPITWSEKFDSMLGTPGYGACVVQFDPDATDPVRLTPTVNTRSIIETSDGLLLIGLEDDIYKIEAETFSAFITDLPFPCANLVLDGNDNIYASLMNDSATILQIFPDGSNSTWFSKDMKEFPNSLVYDSKNDVMVLMTTEFVNETFDLWRLPIDNPYEYSKIASIENVTFGDFTVDKLGNIYVLDRGNNVMYKIPDGTDQVQVFATDVIESAILAYPHIGYSSILDAIIICRNDDLRAWPTNGSSPYVFGVSATGIDHEGLFENTDGDLVGTHSGQIFRLTYDDSTSMTTSTDTSTTSDIPTDTNTTPEGPTSFPIELVSIGAGVALVVVVLIICLKKKNG
jgi:hypothetical protein